ncbi:putative tetratricopeptide-like helical domain superfamily [Helianthus debilis subsp. tardiflorus]
MAIPTPKLFKINWCSSRSIASSNVYRVYDILYTSFCTMSECPKVDEVDDPVEVTESPDLPIWVRITENDSLVTKTPEDDFVLPSVSYWMENYKRDEPKVYDKVTVGNKAESDTKKIMKVLTKRFESVESVVRALNDCNVTPSESLVAQMLKRFDNNWKSAYGAFTWAESCLGSKFSPDMYDLLVDCLGKSKKFDLMRQVVKHMVQIGDDYVTVNTIAKVIRRLAKAGLHEAAIDEFRGIEQFGIKRDLLALNILVDALAKEKNVERANDVFVEFKDEIPPNSHTFNSLIHGWAKARDIGKIQVTMEEMKKHGICPDVVSYTSLIEAYCSEKDFRKVDQVLEEMQQKGCPPNVITYTIIMHARGKSKEIDEALKVYEKIKSDNCVLDASFFSSLIHILSKAGRLKDAREVFDEMPDQGVERDTHTYNTMITSVCEHTQEEDALKLLHEMEKCGVKPNFDTYAPLLKMCLKLKRMKVVSFLLNHMLDNNVSVGLGTYSLLVRGLCKNGKLKHACLFLEDAVMRGFVPYDTMFKLLETELEKEGMTEEKKRIQELKLIRPAVGNMTPT